MPERTPLRRLYIVPLLVLAFAFRSSCATAQASERLTDVKATSPKPAASKYGVSVESKRATGRGNEAVTKLADRHSVGRITDEKTVSRD